MYQSMMDGSSAIDTIFAIDWMYELWICGFSTCKCTFVTFCIERRTTNWWCMNDWNHWWPLLMGIQHNHSINTTIRNEYNLFLWFIQHILNGTDCLQLERQLFVFGWLPVCVCERERPRVYILCVCVATFLMSSYFLSRPNNWFSIHVFSHWILHMPTNRAGHAYDLNRQNS